MGYCVRSRTFSKRWVGKVWAAFALSLGVAGAALAQTAPAVDVKVRWAGGLPQPYGPSDDAWATAYCQNRTSHWGTVRSNFENARQRRLGGGSDHSAVPL